MCSHKCLCEHFAGISVSDCNVFVDMLLSMLLVVQAHLQPFAVHMWFEPWPLHSSSVLSIHQALPMYIPHCEHRGSRLPALHLPRTISRPIFDAHRFDRAPHEHLLCNISRHGLAPCGPCICPAGCIFECACGVGVHLDAYKSARHA